MKQQRVRQFVSLSLALATLAISGDAAQADAWSRSNDCGCSRAPATGSLVPQPAAATIQPQSAVFQRSASAMPGFWMRPTPSYKSSWKQVSVTNYQPQVISDPISGVAVTTIQPCQTYESQLRRTPRCSLWQRLVRWWNQRCCFCIGRPAMPPATTICPPTSQWVIGSTAPTASPYYAPAANGRLVPVPPSVTPTSPVPADRRPQLDPVPPRAGGNSSASRLLPADREVFVHNLVDSTPAFELGPPLVAPRLGNAEADGGEDLEGARPLPAVELDGPSAAADDTSDGLVPVSWSVPTPSYERRLPTEEVWDDTGWQSEQ